MKRELTLTDIAGYLPYGLKLLDRKRGMTTVWEWQSAACCDWNGEEKVEMISGEKYSVCTYLAGMQRYWSQSVSEAVWGLKHCIRSVWARR